jgi:hypothetical protein
LAGATNESGDLVLPSAGRDNALGRFNPPEGRDDAL